MHMQKLISELTRLYLPAGALPPAALERHLRGQETVATRLTTEGGLTRAIVIPFRALGASEPAQHWSRLCDVANALQAQFGFPAPAVSVSSTDGYGLWLSLESPVPIAQAQTFLELLREAYFPDIDIRPDAVTVPLELPPCLNQDTGRWAAFIHPGMGASFADEAGLEMAPPLAGQVAFLEGLQGIGPAQFAHALEALRQSRGAAPTADEPPAARAGGDDTLLLKDATLEDIVRLLHSRNIEPTFRHRIPDRSNPR